MSCRTTIPYSAIEERGRLNKCIEDAPNECEKEIYRRIRDMKIPYEKLDRILKINKKIIEQKKRRKKNLLALSAGGAAVGTFLLLGVFIRRDCQKRRETDE